MKFTELYENVCEGLRGDKEYIKLERELNLAFTATEIIKDLPGVLELEPKGNVPSGDSDTKWSAYWLPIISHHMIKNKLTIKDVKKLL